MLESFQIHNLFKEGIQTFLDGDPHLRHLAQLPLTYEFSWWKTLSIKTPGIYILSGGRQVGKSSSCKQLMAACLKQQWITPERLFYLPCDEIYDATRLSYVLRHFIDTTEGGFFLLIIDEITFVKQWDRVIKALADEGHFQRGSCLITGSDTVILKEAAMCFPGRRGSADTVDFHLYPLTFRQYADLRLPHTEPTDKELYALYLNFLQCGGYLRAINDLAQHHKVTQATYLTYEQWLRGDFIKQGKSEDYLLILLKTLLTIQTSQISYSKIAQKAGLISRETTMNYLKLLERMDVIFNLQAFDQNKRQGFPRKNRKFHFLDPFICHTVSRWLQREGYAHETIHESFLVESSVASYCRQQAHTFYFKGYGEVDIIMMQPDPLAIEVKWTNQIRPNDLKTLKQFQHSLILGKYAGGHSKEGIRALPVYKFLYHGI